MKNLTKLIIASAISCCILNSINAQNNCLNVALKKTTTANDSTITEFPKFAFDGDRTTNWCTPSYTGWISVDLQKSFTVDSIKLYVNQAIDGNTIHEIKVSEDMTNWRIIETLSDVTVENQILKIKFNPSLPNIRGVMINTTHSTSWVAWYEIEVYSNPIKPTISQLGNVLTSSSETNNQWYLNGSPILGAINKTYTISSPGLYQVEITNENGCTTISDPMNTTTQTSNNPIFDIKIYPNPTKRKIFIEGTTDATIEIFNIHGQIVKQQVITQNKTSIDISDLTDGVYSIKINSNKGLVVKKLFKH